MQRLGGTGVQSLLTITTMDNRSLHLGLDFKNGIIVSVEGWKRRLKFAKAVEMFRGGKKEQAFS